MQGSCTNPLQAVNTEDRDSGQDDDELAESTTSISDSVLQYRTIHGRTYHSERGNAQYWYDHLKYVFFRVQLI